MIPCRYAEPAGGTPTIVGAGIDTFWVHAFPATIGMMLIARLVGHEDEMVQEHTVTFELLDDDLGQLAHYVLGPFTPGLNPNRAPGWEAGHVIGAAHQFQVEREGAYALQVRLDGGNDGRALKSIPLRVVDATQTPPQNPGA